MTVDLAKARALCEAAAAGPWRQGDQHEDPWGREMVLQGIDREHPRFSEILIAETFTKSGGKANAAFIAAARTLLPEALDELERLRAEKPMPGPDELPWRALEYRPDLEDGVFWVMFGDGQMMRLTDQQMAEFSAEWGAIGVAEHLRRNDEIERLRARIEELEGQLLSWEASDDLGRATP